MKDINDEIKLTLNLMQTDVSDGAREELQLHLYKLLDMKRDKLYNNHSDVFEVANTHDLSPYKTVIKPCGQTTDESKPLTIEELMLGGWWCADVSKDCADAFISKGLSVYSSHAWGIGTAVKGCEMEDDGEIGRQFHDNNRGLKQIHRVGNEFYWG